VTLSRQEAETLTNELDSTYEGYLEPIDGVSDLQAFWKPEPGVWNIAEIAEHLVVVEKRITSLVRRMAEAEAADPGRDAAELDRALLEAVRNRQKKRLASENSVPTGKVPLSDSMAAFKSAREDTHRILQEDIPFRGRVIPHGVLPPMDGYEWLLAITGHLARHTMQIAELKSRPDFPRRSI
jgi:hypothetical protein